MTVFLDDQSDRFTAEVMHVIALENFCTVSDHQIL
jgi:hypothetical protein